MTRDPVRSDADYLFDECPNCGYGPLSMWLKARRKRCPACLLRIPPRAPDPVR